MSSELINQIDALKPWFQKLDFGDGVVSPGTWNPRVLADFLIPKIPGGVDSRSVLDIGANAGGVGFSFVADGAATATLVESNSVYYEQSQLYINHKCIDSVNALHETAFKAHLLPKHDIVLLLGLFYHFLYPQLFLDYCANISGGIHVISTQAIGGKYLQMRNRKEKYQQNIRPTCGWEPSVPMFTAMLEEAGYDVLEYLPASGRWFTENGFTNNAYFICRPTRANGLDMDAASTLFSPSRVWI